ncbi:MAG: hypothetical protein ABI841_03535 [Chloroflexota bacterium]
MQGGGGRFRFLVLLGALAMIGSGFLPWWRAGGEEVSGVLIPAQEGIGLEGPGLVIYGAAVAALLVLNIGYMRGRWGFFLDGPMTYLVLGLAAAAALLFRGWELWSVGYVPMPQSSPGFAVATVGIAMLLYGAGTGFGAPPRS